MDKREPQPRKIVLPSLSAARLFMMVMLVASFAQMPWVQVDGRPKVSLGSAAISSLTEELSPILPFAGGMDLRRSDYWSTFEGDWFGTLKSVAHQVNEAFAQRGEAKKEMASPTPIVRSKSKRSSKPKHNNAISAPKPFASVEQIAELSLDEVAVMFRFAIESSQPDFVMSRFVSRLTPKVRRVMDRMKDAISRSRGQGVSDFVNAKETSVDEIDALKFVAAMRIFAEWRMIRLVPDGFKGFAVGMSLGHKDVVQNLVKMEDAIHAWLDHHRSIGVQDVMAPSLRQLLTFELETGVHPEQRLPRLTEKTAGMGLLWVSRQLTYQTEIFDNLLHVNRFASSKDAISAAYKTVYDKYHGWAVQKIFSYSFQAAPEAEVCLRHMNPSLPPISQASVASSSTVLTEVDRNVLDSLLDGLFGLFQHEGGDASTDSNEHINTALRKEVWRAAEKQISGYLNVAKPLIGHMQALLADLNMDDPSRV